MQPEIRSFVSVLPSRLSCHWTGAKRRMLTASKSGTFLATESVNSAPFKRGERGANFIAITKLHIFGQEKCKIHRQFQRYFGDVTSVSLSLSLSLTERTERTI